ncbi:MAG TPA: hypothetical protein PKL92_03930, partial [Aquaticitalea sp.]|nr:hypothetical protein [Aquaticitalea sp.]
MRNRLTDQAKIIALLLLAAFLTNGCQREDFQKDLEHGHAIEQSIPFSFKRKTFEQLKNDPKFSGAYDKVSQKVKEQDLANAKTVMEDQYGFVIDSTLIKEVSSDGYVSYTFLIYRETPSEGFFENLVVDVDSLDNIRAYIVKYTPNSPSVYIPEDDAYSLDATAEITPIDFNDQQVQSKVSYTDGNGCLVTLMCPYGGTPHPAGPACIAAERGNLYWSAPACPNDGYGNNYPDYSGGIGNGGGSGNNNNGNNNNNNGGSGNNPPPHPGNNGSGNNNGNNNNNNLPVITDPVVDGEQNPQCLALTQVAQLVSALGLNSGQAAMIRSNCAFG